MRASRGTVATCLAVLAVSAVLAGCAAGSGQLPGSARPSTTSGGVAVSLTTTAFTPIESSGGTETDANRIPARFAMRAVPGGQNLSIPYSWEGAPAPTRSYALTLVDTAPVAREWVHWMVVDIPASARALGEGASGRQMPPGSRELKNTFGFEGYDGPQPPPGSGVHTYAATLYALDLDQVDVSEGASLAQFRSAISGHVLAQSTCTGTFSR